MVEPQKKATSYVVVGNPGAGKSTLLNGLMNGLNFESGVSLGEGKTQVLKIVQGNDRRKFIDTPGLADIEIRNQAAEEIGKAFQTGGPYTLLFVITLEAGRLRPDDLATIALVVKATGLKSNKFAVVVNKITTPALKKLRESPEARKKLFVGINATLPAKTMFIYYYPKDQDLDDQDNKVLKIDEEFQYYLNACPIVPIVNATNIDTDASKWTKLRKLVSENYENIRKAAEENNEEYKSMTKDIQKELLKSQDRLFRHCPRCALFDGRFWETKRYSLNKGIFVTCVSCQKEIGDSIEYCTKCTLRACALCLQTDFNLELTEFNHEIISTVFDPNGAKSKPTSYVVVGNPGAGKSTFLNGLMNEVNFESGVSFGDGKTQSLKVMPGVDGRKFIDTPGLADIEIRQKAAEAIDEAFTTGGPYTLVFVVTIEAGRLRPDDLATMKLVLDSTRLESNQFSVIINKLTENVMKKLEESPEARKKIFTKINAALPAKTMFIYYYQHDKDLEDSDNKKLPMTEGLQKFLDACPLVPIANSTKIDTNKWKSFSESLNKELTNDEIKEKEVLQTRTKLIYCPRCALFDMIYEKIQPFDFTESSNIKDQCASCQVEMGNGFESCHKCELKICPLCLYDFNIDKLQAQKKVSEYAITCPHCNHDFNIDGLKAQRIANEYTNINKLKVSEDFKSNMSIEKKTAHEESKYTLHQSDLSMESLEDEGQPSAGIKIDLSNKNMSDEGAEALSQSVSWKNFIELGLVEKTIEDTETPALSENLSWVDLTELRLSSNSIAGNGATSLSKNASWTNLTKLYLNENSIDAKGALALSQNLSWMNLAVLDLASNSIGTKGVTSLSKNTSWPNLKELHLGYNSIDVKGAMALSQNLSWTKLSVLNLGGNDINEKGVTALSKNMSWVNLKELDLNANSIGDNGVKALSENLSWTKLLKLDLSSNNISGEGTAALSKNMSWTNLTKLNLAAMTIIHEEFGINLTQNVSWTKLNVLDLGSNANCVNSGIKAISENMSWANIKELYLPACFLKDEGATTLSENMSWKNLSVLDLGSNYISDEGVTALSENLSWVNLKELDLNSNSFGDNGVRALSENLSWTNLSKLDLSSNNPISGEGATALSENMSWANLKELFLLNNNSISEEGLTALKTRWPNLNLRAEEAKKIYKPGQRLEGDDRKESNTFNQNSHQIEESKLSIREDISTQFSDGTWELLELSLTDAKFGDDKAIAIASNKTWVNLTKLQLPNNSISAKGAIELTKNTTWTELAVLNLGVNSIGDEGAKELAKNTSWTKLVFLDLIKNSIGDEGAEELAKNTSWTNLVNLGLDQNLIGDKGAKGLAKNISWAKLEELNIHYNYSLGDEGVLALLNNTTWTNLKKTSIGMFPESKILQDPQDFELLREWISPISKVIFKLLYQGSRDGYGAAMFHKKCDNSMNTVTIVKSKTHNKIFGGYCDAFWNPFSNYKNATDNFLFSITEKRKYDLKANCKIYGSYANASYGPTFGGGHDFMIADNCNTNSASYSNFGHTYYNGQNDGYDQTKLAGAYNFTVEEIEVYHVDFDQETVSGVLKDADFKQIKEWITNDKKIQLLRIYQATKHGFNASNFHTMCDHQGPTVVVIKSSLGKTFGGFTDKDWTSDGVYRESSNSFLFSIDKKGKYPLKRGQESTAWYCCPSYGPTFGGGHDFMIADNCNTNSASYSYFPYSYDCNENVQPSTSDYLAGAYNFQVDEIEVFSVQ